MGRRNKAVKAQAHQLVLQEVDKLLARGLYHQALETTRRLQHGVSAETKAHSKVREIQAHLGLGRATEAYVAAGELERIIRQHRLWSLELEFEEVLTRATLARKPPLR